MKHDELKVLHGVEPVPDPPNKDDVRYRLADIRARPGVVVTEPLRECYLAVRVSECGTHVHYAGLVWTSEDDDGVEVEVLFTGNGTGGSLREMRHTNWGPDDSGYVFYLPLAKTIALLEALKQYFDD